jgi:MOSC domain-containing protein YiiM
MEGQMLASYLEETEPGYTCRVLADGTVACKLGLIFTRALILGVTERSYARRFCFDDRDLADQRFEELATQDDEPPGYIALR